MKITKAKLKQIIKEELSVLNEYYDDDKSVEVQLDEDNGDMTMTFKSLADWLNNLPYPPDLEIVLLDEDKNQFYRIHDVKHDSASNKAHMSIKPTSEPPE